MRRRAAGEDRPEGYRRGHSRCELLAVWFLLHDYHFYVVLVVVFIVIILLIFVCYFLIY